MRIRIEVGTFEHLEGELLGSSGIGRAQKFEIPESGGATLEYQGTLVRKADGIPSVIELALHVADGVAIGIVANWLYGKLKGRNEFLRIEETETVVDKDEITRCITRITTKSR